MSYWFFLIVHLKKIIVVVFLFVCWFIQILYLRLRFVLIDLTRRTCDKLEKDFLRERGVVTETQSDLGKLYNMYAMIILLSIAISVLSLCSALSVSQEHLVLYEIYEHFKCLQQPRDTGIPVTVTQQIKLPN